MEEAWLRGITQGMNSVAAHLLRASQQIREEAGAALTGLDTEAIWSKPFELNSAGFHAKHLAGSTQRLCSYLEGKPSIDSPDESSGDEGAAELLRAIDVALIQYEFLVNTLDPSRFSDLREVGRKRLPVTAIGLAIHIAEHGQRHAGQLVSAVKLTLKINGKAANW